MLHHQSSYDSRYWLGASAFKSVRPGKQTEIKVRLLRQSGSGERVLPARQSQNMDNFVSVFTRLEHCSATCSIETVLDSKQLDKSQILLATTSTEESDQKLSSHNSMNDIKSSEGHQARGAARRLRERKPFKYQVDSEPQQNQKLTKPCETKNIVKNFMRSFASFVRKNDKFMDKLSKHLQIPKIELTSFVEATEGKINTIIELREIWTTSKFSKAWRIISSHFLRQHYPKHIFHSRIFNYQIHLKYRLKLLLSLTHPQQFTSLKQF